MTIIGAMLALPAQVQALEWDGVIDLRAAQHRGAQAWPEGGLGKQRFGPDDDGVRLGQGMVLMRGEPLEDLTATLIVSADDARRGVVDVTEAWLQWKPVPTSAWQSRLKAGAFFMPISLEHDGPAWTTTRTLSASAINSWIGEEFRTIGLEWTLAHRGRAIGSPHDLSLTAALFGYNDPAGTLLTWRGWGIGDRITGLSETLPLAPLPVYGPRGILNKQAPVVESFMEIDRRPGYYLSAHYAYQGRINVSVAHYDNRGDPFAVRGGQYAWTTRFRHLGLAFKPAAGWTLLMQAMDGMTLMGRPGARIDYTAHYALLDVPAGVGNLALRHDRFRTREDDLLPQDNNNERGHAWTLSYRRPWLAGWQVQGEWLQVNSTRPAREQIGARARLREQSLTLALRRQF
ncbi:hypothetical protein [Chitinimonas sp. BJYL2]|uniref:hypothetical protein n=1 Tax=Chitinimonas sp. BJYL2 TaxID=2976696 RepID=UPI0022B44D6F|nr:hypothetical protein [Chitinimonas sp. BJYL2]